MSTREPQSSSNDVAATIVRTTDRKWWLKMATYTLCVLFGQILATLLVRLYYNKGGKNVWLTSLVETIGFPILIPFYLYFKPLTYHQLNTNNNTQNTQPSLWVLSGIYISLGLLQSVTSILYSLGLYYLPLSTFSLISTTQLAFNAFFAFFLNAQKLTPLIINSLVLLTISTVLLVLQSDSEENQVGVSQDQQHLKLGFVVTIVASALYSLGLSLTQLSFQKVLKGETFSIVLNMIIYQSLVASIVTIIALFVSGQWNDLQGEMVSFELGNISYWVIIICVAIAWQIATIGGVGLIFEVSSLFSNVISTLALPIIPVLAVIVFHEKMNGIKVIATVLAIWGFASYVYQHYLDESQPAIQSEVIDEVVEEVVDEVVETLPEPS
uniref:probable purine permease 10 n=1 Tax=Erigeron canadensis TaxID=72917 RepID=UPI001CB8BED2|nr:probable purine permease 10 [Erigeron canadensis]